MADTRGFVRLGMPGISYSVIYSVELYTTVYYNNWPGMVLPDSTDLYSDTALYSNAI